MELSPYTPDSGKENNLDLDPLIKNIYVRVSRIAADILIYLLLLTKTPK